MFKYLLISTSTLVFLIYVFPDVLHFLRTTKNPIIRRVLHDLVDAIIYPMTFVRITAIVVRKLINGEYNDEQYKEK